MYQPNFADVYGVQFASSNVGHCQRHPFLRCSSDDDCFTLNACIAEAGSTQGALATDAAMLASTDAGIIPSYHGWCALRDNKCAVGQRSHCTANLCDLAAGRREKPGKS